MNKTKIGIYVALIFLAGAFAGYYAGPGIRALGKTSPPPPPPVRSREDFANHIFNRMKERLALSEEQIQKIEPTFRKSFEEVRAIQDRSVKEVELAVKRNHEELGKLLTPEQRVKLEEWDREREKAMRERRNHRRGPGGPPADGPGGPDGSAPPERLEKSRSDSSAEKPGR